MTQPSSKPTEELPSRETTYPTITRATWRNIAMQALATSSMHPYSRLCVDEWEGAMKRFTRVVWAGGLQAQLQKAPHAVMVMEAGETFLRVEPGSSSMVVTLWRLSDDGKQERATLQIGLSLTATFPRCGAQLVHCSLDDVHDMVAEVCLAWRRGSRPMRVQEK